MRLFLVSLFSLIAGCGTVSSLKGNPTSFTIVTYSQAGGAYALIRGKVIACKISQHGTESPYVVRFENDLCIVQVMP